MFRKLFEEAPRAAARSREPTGPELLADAAADADSVLMFLGDPPLVVPGRLHELRARHVAVSVAANVLENNPPHGHLVLVQLMRDSRSVAFHGRVDAVEASGGGPILILDKPSQFLVVQARRSFRIPTRGLEIEHVLDIDGPQACTLLDVSLGGVGVRIDGKPLAVGASGSLVLTHAEVSLRVPARVVAVSASVHGLELIPASDLLRERLRKLIMGIERAWVLNERRVR